MAAGDSCAERMGWPLFRGHFHYLCGLENHQTTLTPHNQEITMGNNYGSNSSSSQSSIGSQIGWKGFESEEDKKRRKQQKKAKQPSWKDQLIEAAKGIM